jgi:hypothetical protein
MHADVRLAERACCGNGCHHERRIHHDVPVLGQLAKLHRRPSRPRLVSVAGRQHDVVPFPLHALRQRQKGLEVAFGSRRDEQSPHRAAG